jgi:excisionase family DNA binding protein
MTDEPFMTTEEVIEYLQVNARTVYRLVKAGKLPAVRVGRQWRFRKRDIDSWLENRNRHTVSAPAVPVTAVREARQPQQYDPHGRPKVLVVDDEENVRKLLVKALSVADYDVDAASDGPTALDQLRKTDYQLLVTDLRLPGMDGLEIVRQARRSHLDVPVVIITGHSDEDTAIEAANLGVRGYLKKPLKMHTVMEAAARILGD